MQRRLFLAALFSMGLVSLQKNACGFSTGFVLPKVIKLPDGTIVTSGFRNGYAVKETFKAAGRSVLAYEFDILAKDAATTTTQLIRAANVDLELATNFPALPGEFLIVRVGRVQGNFNVVVNGKLFQDTDAATHVVAANQPVRVLLASAGTLP